MQPGELSDPGFLAGHEIHLQPKPDGELRVVLPRLLHVRHVVVQPAEFHAPFIKSIARHGRMVGEPDFLESERHGTGSVFRGLPGGVVAQGCVHVVIRRPRHAGRLADNRLKSKAQTRKSNIDTRRNPP